MLPLASLRAEISIDERDIEIDDDGGGATVDRSIFGHREIRYGHPKQSLLHQRTNPELASLLIGTYI